MTEAGPVLSMCLAFAKEPFEIKSGSCGTVVRNAELKIVDPETGSSLPRNQAGEICIRGSQIMKGTIQIISFYAAHLGSKSKSVVFGLFFFYFFLNFLKERKVSFLRYA